MNYSIKAGCLRDVHNFAHPSLYYVGTEAKVIVGFRKEKEVDHGKDRF
jgi:hypothetical protein